MDIKLVIPARFKSTRLPGKPLINILGVPMLQRTYNQCVKAIDRSDIFVATENEDIKNYCESNNIQVVMTSDSCMTGTDRIAEFSKKVKSDYYINVQGDEPIVNPADISAMIDSIKKYPGYVLNGMTEIDESSKFFNNSIPKVVYNNKNELLYMSRSPIPGNKESTFLRGWRQVCIYCFSKHHLEKFSRIEEKTRFEKIEDIEILRFLEIGIKVKMINLSSCSIAVDTPDDVLAVEKYISNNQKNY